MVCCCPPQKYNCKTGRCKKPCRKDQKINPLTNRCVKKQKKCVRFFDEIDEFDIYIPEPIIPELSAPGPTFETTLEPTVEPTFEPTFEPTVEPTVEPTFEPTFEPAVEPTFEPAVESTVEPTFEEPSVEPTFEEPTFKPGVKKTCKYNKNKNTYTISSPACPLSSFSVDYSFVFEEYTFYSVEQFVLAFKASFYGGVELARTILNMDKIGVSSGRLNLPYMNKRFLELKTPIKNKKWLNIRQDIILFANIIRITQNKNLVGNLKSTGESVFYKGNYKDEDLGVTSLMKIRNLINSGFFM